MTWLVLVIVVIAIVLLMKKKPAQEAPQQAPHGQEQSISHSAAPSMAATAATEDQELIAVITAAIYAMTGTDGFKVLSITPSASKWALTGRQDIMNSRL